MRVRSNEPSTVLIALALAAAAALGVALVAQYVFNLQPCVLCVYQRWPLLALALLGGGAGLVLRARPVPGLAAMALLGVVALALLDVGIAGYHVGVEQHWWAGSAECTGPAGAATTLEELKAQIMATPVTRCDEAAFTLFGISMAGYNLLFCLVLAAVGARTLLLRRAAPPVPA